MGLNEEPTDKLLCKNHDERRYRKRKRAALQRNVVYPTRELGPYPTRGRPPEWRPGIGPDMGLVTSLPAGNMAGVLVGKSVICDEVLGVGPWNFHPLRRRVPRGSPSRSPTALSAEGRAILDVVSPQSPGQRNPAAADSSLCL